MQINKVPYLIDRPIPRARPVTAARRRRNQRNQRNLGKLPQIVPIATAIISMLWAISLPLRGQHHREPPAISTPKSTEISAVLPIKKLPPLASAEKAFVYNVKEPPSLLYNQDLQDIVDELVQMAKDKGLSTDALSISLIDVSNPQFHSSANYQGQVLRFPASVAKMFWMVAFFAAVEKGMIPDEKKYYSHLDQMMRVSNNDAASRILDALTDTKSGPSLGGEDLQNWLEKRKSIDKFYEEAGFEGFKMSTKNYPIYYLRQPGPRGRDLQLKEGSISSIRNQVTTDQAARLIYDIYTRQAISPTASRKMAYLMTRNLDPKDWKKDPLNCIKGFFGESLPTNIYFGSKVGLTTKSRQEVAFIRTLDDRAIYILAIFGDDEGYGRDEEIFPAMSKRVFERMTSKTANQ